MTITGPLMLLSGVALGFFYFSGLYWTLRKLSTQESRVWWLALSFLARASILAVIFYLLADRDWQRLLLLAAGFTISRFVWVRKIKKEANP